jgi:O-antigen/teichoic acid export membrane protein
MRRILANAISLLLAYALPRVFTVGAVIIAARVLGTTRFGAYGTAAAFAVILSIVATLGMSPLLVREMAKAPERSGALLAAAHRLKTLSNAVMLVLLYVLGRWALGYPPEVLAAAMLLGIAYAIAAYGENLASWFQSIERMHVWTQASAAYGLVTGVVGAVLVLATGSVVAFCAAPIAGQAVALIWLVHRLPPEVRANRRGDPVRMSWFAAALGPFAAGFVFLTIHSKIDVLVLAQIRSPDEVGLYAAGYKFIDLAQALAVVIAAAMYPRLSRAAPAEQERAQWAGRRLIELAVLGAALAGALLVAAREPIVTILFGNAYAASTPVVLLLGIAAPALVLNIVSGYVLAAAGRMKDVATLYGGAMVLKLVFNLLLVPIAGARGAAMAMLATEMSVGVGMLFLLRARLGAMPGNRTAAAIAGAATVTAGAVLLPDPTHGIIAATLAILGTLAVYIVAGVISSAERRILVEAVGLGARRPA